MAACLTGRKHAHEKTVGTLAIHDDHLPLKRFGMSEDDDGRRLGVLCRSDARKAGYCKQRYAHQMKPCSTFGVLDRPRTLNVK
jgi:hypothetical protein